MQLKTFIDNAHHGTDCTLTIEVIEWPQTSSPVHTSSQPSVLFFYLSPFEVNNLRLSEASLVGKSDFTSQLSTLCVS